MSQEGDWVIRLANWQYKATNFQLYLAACSVQVSTRAQDTKSARYDCMLCVTHCQVAEIVHKEPVKQVGIASIKTV